MFAGELGGLERSFQCNGAPGEVGDVEPGDNIQCCFMVRLFLFTGELDGGGISYLRREWEETQDLPQEKQLLTKTILVPQVCTVKKNALFSVLPLFNSINGFRLKKHLFYKNKIYTPIYRITHRRYESTFLTVNMEIEKYQAKKVTKIYQI